MPNRRDRLKSEQRALEETLGIYSTIDTGDCPEIRLRNSFIYLPVPRQPRGGVEHNGLATPVETRLKRDWNTRPPLTYLIHRRTRALQLYLTAVYLAHCEQSGRSAVGNLRGISHHLPGGAIGTWVAVSGLGGRGAPRARRARVIRALDELADANLVRLGEGRARYEGFQLLRDDASQRAYTVPGDDAKDALTLPASFFLNGWHLVLEPREIAMLLTILHAQRLYPSRRRDQDTRGVAIPEKLRDTRYGISGEVYDSIHQLNAFRLIDIIDIMPNRAGGKVAPHREYFNWRGEVDVVEMPPSPVPYEFRAHLNTTRRKAFEVVMGHLKPD